MVACLRPPDHRLGVTKLELVNFLSLKDKHFNCWGSMRTFTSCSFLESDIDIIREL